MKVSKPFIFIFLAGWLISFNAFPAYTTVGVGVDKFTWKKINDSEGEIVSVHAYLVNDSSGPCTSNSEPAKRGAKCEVYIGSDYFQNNSESDIFNANHSTTADSKELVNAINQLKGKRFTLTSTTRYYPCIWFETSGWALSTDGPLPGTCTTNPNPPPVPDTVVCTISKNMIIDYGNLDASKINGNKKSDTAVITCNGDANVVVNVRNKTDKTNIIELRDDKSVSTKLTVDGKDTSDNGLNLSIKKDQPQTLTVDSELIANGTPAAGTFSGTGVALVTVQ